MNLNPAQQQAVDLDATRIACRAAPGSGKTRVLTERAARILSIPGIHPSEVALITFTRSAAAEMRERLEKVLPDKRERFWRQLTVTTFHAWALKMLRLYHDRLGFPPHFTIRDTRTDRDDVVMYSGRILDLLAADGNKPKKGQVTSARGLWGKDPVRTMYRSLLREANALDIDQIEDSFLHLLKRDAGVREHLRGRFRYVLADEAQDQSAVQQDILDVLAPENLFIVGDPGQSLYSFRGANPEGFHAVCARPDWVVVDLPTNYRSRPPIVEAASRLARAMNPVGLTQEAGREPDETADADALAVIAAPSRHEVALRIVEEVKALHEAGTAWKDMAVLCPNWDLLEEMLPLYFTDKGIPARLTRKSGDAWDQPEVKWLVNCARVALNPDDHLSLWGALNAFTPRVTLEVWSRMRATAASEGKTILDVFLSATPKTCEHIRQALVELSDVAAGANPFPVNMQSAIPELVADLVRLHLDTRAEGLVAIGKQLMPWFNVAAAAAGEDEVVDLQAFLDWYMERHVHEEAADAERDEVTLTTIHGAKGLEWPCLWVIGVEEGRLPKAKEDGPGMEEERRKAYVGLTRGKERVRLCVSLHRAPSRFIKEALPEWMPSPELFVGVDHAAGLDPAGTDPSMFARDYGAVQVLDLAKRTYNTEDPF